jgi:hypothetical protein
MDTPAVAPVTPQAQAMPTTPPQVVTTPPATAANGAVTPSTSSFQDSLKKAVSNPVQLGFGILTTAALFYAIYYFQYNIRFSKTFVKNVENKIDDLDMKYADLLSKLNSKPAETMQDDLNLNLW